MSFVNFDNIDVDNNFYNNNYPSINGNIREQYFDSANFCESFDSYNRPNLADLKLIHVNIRSIQKNGDKLLTYLETLNVNFDVVCLTETWLLKDFTCIHEMFPDYNAYHSVRPGNQPSGGVTVLIHSKYSSREIVSLSCNTPYLESVFAEIEHKGKIIRVCSCYRPPGLINYDLFLSELESKLYSINVNSIDCFLCGDFNLDLIQLHENRNVSRFYDLLTSLSLIPHILRPTRCTETSQTLIDNIFSNVLLEMDAGILEIDLSDHFPIFILAKNVFVGDNFREKIEYRVINERSLQNLFVNLCQYQYSDFIIPDDCNESINKLDSIILKEYNNCCPIKVKTVSHRERKNPWISFEIKSLIRRRENFHKLLLQRKMSRMEYNRFRNFVTSKIKLAKKNYYYNLLESIKADIKKTWGVINKLLKPKNCQNKKQIASLKLGDNMHSDSQSISNILNDHFASVGGNISNAFAGNNNANSYDNVPYQPTHMTFENTTAYEVFKVINSLKNKSCPVSSYPVKVLKYISDIISPILADIINNSFSTGTFPELLKVARVVPVYKGGDKTEPNNYRPISILPILSKIFERIAHTQLQKYFDNHNLLTDCQYGFRKGRSTTQAILDNLQYIYENLDRGSIVISVFLDFSKAFDCIDHDILLKKLDLYGVRGMAGQWFKSYLSQRSQYVSIDKKSSNSARMSYGVPQGSILGPLLFLIFINDFPSCNPFFRFTLFADDSTLSCKFPKNSNPDIIKNSLSVELSKINKWLENNKIKINYDKTKFIIFNYRKTIEVNSLKIGNNQITRANSVKFLGIYIDEKLSFKTHIDNISEKTGKTVGLLYRLNKFLPDYILKTLYHCLVSPHISYGIEAWYAAPKTATDRISVIQKKVIRAINRLPYNTHTNDYFKSMRIPKLEDIYHLQLGKYMFTNQNKFNLVSDVHSHNTRSRNNLALPLYNLSHTQKFYKYRGIKLWNTLPDNIIKSTTVQQLGAQLKSYLIDKY